VLGSLALRPLKLALVINVWATLLCQKAGAADRAACFDAATRGQTLRDEHQLLEARDKFRQCAQEECPESMRGDCAEWLEAVERSIATVVFVATDEGGAVVFDVSVRVLLLAKLDGRAVSVNPGLHTFSFRRADGASAEAMVQANEGEKNQKVAVLFSHLGAPPAPEKAAVLPPDGTAFPLSPRAPGMPVRKILGLGAMAVGGAGIALGGVFAVLSAFEFNQQKSDCAASGCTNPTHAQALAAHSRAIADGDIATAAFIGGGVLSLAGAILAFTEPHRPTRGGATGLAVWSAAGREGAILYVRADF